MRQELAALRLLEWQPGPAAQIISERGDARAGPGCGRFRRHRCSKVAAASAPCVASLVRAKLYRKGLAPPNKGRRLPAEILTADELRRLMASLDMTTKRVVRNAAMTALMARAGLKIG